METAPERLRAGSAIGLVRLGLAAFVLLWLLGPDALQAYVPIWIVFLIALGLEANYFLGGWRPGGGWRVPADRLPQPVDRERYGYAEPRELTLVHRDGEEFWIPWAGEEGEELERLIEEARERPEPEPATAASAPGRRRLGQFLVGCGLIAALALVVWVAETRGGWRGLDADQKAEATRLFSAEASRIAGHPVTIRCDDAGEFVGAVQHADGIAEVGGTRAYLTPERCDSLYRLAFEDQVKSSQTGRAIAVLAHEAWHLRGISNESTTECYALQSGVELGRRLGLAGSTARQLMRQQLAENPLHGRGSPDYLVTSDCRNGGALDLDPDSSEFP
jgi:hypothetical protein